MDACLQPCSVRDQKPQPSQCELKKAVEKERDHSVTPHVLEVMDPEEDDKLLEGDDEEALLEERESDDEDSRLGERDEDETELQTFDAPEPDGEDTTGGERCRRDRIPEFYR